MSIYLSNKFPGRSEVTTTFLVGCSLLVTHTLISWVLFIMAYYPKSYAEIYPDRDSYVYSLSDPFTDELCYIGRSSNIKRRIQLHRSPGSQQIGNDRLKNWLVWLYDQKTSPRMRILHHCKSYESSISIEKMLIRKLHPKYNIIFNDGGYNG